MFKKLSALALMGALSFVGVSSSYAHEVKSGDTMSKIANEYSIPLDELAKMNPNVSNIDLIYVGQDIDTTGNAKIVHETKPAPAPVKQVTSNSELDLFYRIVSAEARSESYSGKVAVANVILNRVESSSFPNTITGVIYQAGQFSPITNGSINKEADSESVRAVNEALRNRVNDGSVFFYNPSISGPNWLDSRPTVKVIGNHVFKK